jgi:hypothetical protein
MSDNKPPQISVVEVPLRSAQPTLVESFAATIPYLFVALLLLGFGLKQLFSGGRSSARRSVRWYLRYWQSFFGIQYNPSSKANLRKRHSGSRKS